ncbi:NADase-type glycan-binding domain-containing protein [Nocardioides sp. AE5]|uniref:NADase-type glycan-binding domain-containing protein n=1 Tax=Nocardioides sp. AE5 TaxID=2962573 RepID=UPI0028823512|nr:hypothetical protein [Nocardioides sp. AE5]MDT0201227.1 hypothetical protein [Nocardioides sp. AE5]
MSFCKSCGAVLGVGRFCTNCGAAVSPAAPAVPGNHQESPAERTNPRMPAVQPDAATGARYPLFADEPPQAPQPHAAPPQSPSYQAPPAWLSNPEPAPAGGIHRGPDDEERRRSPALWAVPLVLVLLLLTAGGIWLATRDDDSDNTVAKDTPSSPADAEPDDEDPSDPPASEPPSEDEDEPTAPTNPGGPPLDISKQVKASGPDPIAPGVDLKGDKVSYPATNLLDGDPSTAYRLAGDASGATVTFTLPAGTTVMEVGLVNGYAKKDKAGDRTVDWYDRNRRVLEVEWTFDDGTTVTQTLAETTEMQVLAVNSIASGKVIMKITKVSDEPTGELAKDVTAMGEVVVRGRTG